MSDDFSALAYSVERTYPVDVDRMWSAWTDAPELEQWYAPTDLSVVPGSVVSDAVIGGRKEHLFGTACRQPDGSWQVRD
jgi:uncharacterized protein YndB with AHSA1/START domain